MSQEFLLLEAKNYLEDSYNYNGMPRIPILLYLEVRKYVPYQTEEFQSR